jgi:branched-chain amino acid transport system substrate-binding protein
VFKLTNVRHAVGILLGCAALAASHGANAQDCVVKLGVAGPMTGNASLWGLALKAGTEFEAAWVNDNGGLPMGNRKCKVEVLTFDAQATGAGGAAAANHFASEKVHAVIGPIVSPETTGLKPVAKRNGLINFSMSFAFDVIGPEFPLAFHAVQSPPVWGPSVIKAARDKFKFNSTMVMGANDQGGTDTSKALAAIYASAGSKVSEEYFQRGTTNFAPIAARIMNANPDNVELAGMGPAEAAILARQLLEAGYEGSFGRLSSGADFVIKGVGGPDKLKAFFFMEHAPLDDPGIVKLRADFQRLMKTPFVESGHLPIAQMAAEQVLRAYSQAGTDQDADKILAELTKTTPNSRYIGPAGWRGKAQFGINHEMSFPIGMGVVAKGKREPMLRIPVAAE